MNQEVVLHQDGSQELVDFSQPERYPFLIGVYLAVNAIPDAYAIVDGPNCLFFKAEYIQGRHDIQSTLLDVFGNHRIALTNIHTGNVAMSRGDAVQELLLRIDALQQARVIFVSSLPMVTIIGTMYDTLLRDTQPLAKALLVDCPGRSLQGDWLDGYSDMLIALATRIELADGEPDPRKIAVVGHLMDRNEGDQTGNVREMERMVGALGLELVTVWLGGQNYSKLQEIRFAGTILAFPSGRKAAAIIGKRNGARVIHVDVPFGLARSRKFIDTLARATGTQRLAEEYVERELYALMPKVEWLVPHVFIGKRLGFSAAPDYLGGFVQIATELGAEVVHLSAPANPSHLHEDLGADGDVLPTVLFGPRIGEGEREARRLTEVGIDLLICNSPMRERIVVHCSYMAFGFPNYFHHVLSDAPFLGFRGWLVFVERMANALMSGVAQSNLDSQRKH